MAIATISPHAAIGIRFHQAACVYPCEFNTSFMPETARAHHGCRLRRSRSLDRGPQLGLQSSRIGIDLPKLLLIARFIEQNALIEIILQQCAHFRRIGGRQQVCPDVFRADRVGLGFLVVLALIVPADSHRKAESDDEAEQRQSGGHDNIQIS